MINQKIIHPINKLQSLNFQSITIKTTSHKPFKSLSQMKATKKSTINPQSLLTFPDACYCYPCSKFFSVHFPNSWETRAKCTCCSFSWVQFMSFCQRGLDWSCVSSVVFGWLVLSWLTNFYVMKWLIARFGTYVQVFVPWFFIVFSYWKACQKSI